MKRIHFIAIGGSAMHNLALALADSGYEITGSDDAIFEPSRSRLQRAGILPEKTGWFPEKISASLDGVVLGMHAHRDNPELARAKELGIPVWSYPEYLFQASRNLKRMVIAGSHGKTSITAAVLHVLNQLGRRENFMVGAQLEGYDRMVRLAEGAEWMILEGDEYLTSPLDSSPKFLWYRPHVAIITGIAWDHYNVFPTFDSYLQQFRRFIEVLEEGATLVYFREDEHLMELVCTCGRKDLKLIPYGSPTYSVSNGVYSVEAEGRSYSMQLVGEHNMQNLLGASLVMQEMGVPAGNFWQAVSSFSGASGRMERIVDEPDFTVYRDFGHAPSKVAATIRAVREQFPDRHLAVVMELHTYSSLNRAFLEQYAETTDPADSVRVYFDPEVVRLKRLPELEPQWIRDQFRRQDIHVVRDKRDLEKQVQELPRKQSVWLIMSSGSFGGVDFHKIADTRA